MTITANLVKELRERTGAGMMECKKALEAAQGDIEAAITAMRKSGQAKAAKKAGRIAADGAIVIKTSAAGSHAFMVEINCETDFVARDHNFLSFVNAVAEVGLANRVAKLELLATSLLPNGKTVTQEREELVAKIGENITIRRLELLETSGTVGSYVHTNSRIGVLVELVPATQAEVARDLAMHIAASKPIALDAQGLPQELVAKEKEICLAQVASSGKPAEILEKMVVGRMQKFVNENTLLNQTFVKNQELTIAQLLQQAKTSVRKFTRFEVGEGLDKQTSDFAAEVAQMAGQR